MKRGRGHAKLGPRRGRVNRTGVKQKLKIYKKPKKKTLNK